MGDLLERSDNQGVEYYLNDLEREVVEALQRATDPITDVPDGIA